MLPRLYCPSPLALGAIVDLAPSAAHHAARVLRLSCGDKVILFDGNGSEFPARLLGGDQAQIEACTPMDREAPLQITLAQALPSGDKMDWVVQKAVELGVACIQPLAARRSVVRLSGERERKRIEHWQQVAVSACEQCGRNRVPSVEPLLDLPRFLGLAARSQGTRLLLAPEAAPRLRELSPPSGRVTLLIGPEGGFENDEIQAATAAGFSAIRLGPRVLRTETTGLAAVAAMLALWGDF